MTKTEFILLHPDLTPKELGELGSTVGLRITEEAVRRVRYRSKQAEHGFCRSCTKKTAPGKRYCPEHLSRISKKIAEHRRKRKAAGLCWRCGEPARPGGLLCDVHRVTVTAKEAVVEGRDAQPILSCVICGRRTSKRYCPEHLKVGQAIEQAARYQKTSVGETCPYCHVYGHTIPSCRKYRHDHPRGCKVCGKLFHKDCPLDRIFCSEKCRDRSRSVLRAETPALAAMEAE